MQPQLAQALAGEAKAKNSAVALAPRRAPEVRLCMCDTLWSADHADTELNGCGQIRRAVGGPRVGGLSPARCRSRKAKVRPSSSGRLIAALAKRNEAPAASAPDGDADA